MSDEAMKSVRPPTGLLPPDARWPGLYVGTIVAVDDRPIDQGGACEPPVGDTKGPMFRVKVRVPEVYGPDLPDDALPWAWPCLPAGIGVNAKKGVSGIFWHPEVGTSGWVQFERADPQFPVWMGVCPGRRDELTEIPSECSTKTRFPYESEAERSKSGYGKIRVFKAFPELGMCIRFVKGGTPEQPTARIDIILDDGTWIELDGTGDPASTIGEAQPGSLHLHSTARRIVVSSDMDDPRAITLKSREGGIWIEAAGNIALVSHDGVIYRASGVDPADALAKLNDPEQGPESLDAHDRAALGQPPLTSDGVADLATGQVLSLDKLGHIIKSKKGIKGIGGVAGSFYHPALGGHPGASL